MWRSIVLQAAIARQSALAARAWEDFGSSIAEEGSQEPDSCNSQLGDTFHAASEILLPLDVAWLALAVLAVLVVLLCAQQLGLHVDGSSGPEKFPGTQWYRAGFSSLTSHAAGIVGFVGFQKIVVARIVALSDTCDLWSLHNFLLYTTLALSVVAVSASFVFLGVDYARRLAIDAAKQKGFRLVLKAKKLENTGMGLAIIALGGLMVLLYALVILKEASQQKKHIDHKWLLLDTVCGGGTVLLFYLNLRGLYQSPKVQFDATCHEVDKRITLEDFLEMHSVTVREGPSSLATVLERVAGEDLALLATRCTRRAILPSQRWAPLVHVICGLLLLGAFPLVVHLGANSLFAKPKLEDLKALTGTVLEISESSDGSDVWFWNAPTSKQFLFLNSEAAKLQVTPTYQQTSRIELCCPSLRPDCERERLNHSLIKFFKEPVVLSVPYRSNSSADCKLTLHGLSSRSETTFEIRIESKVQHHLCDCSLEGCPCCGGFHGELKFSNLSKNLSKLGLKQSSELLRNVCQNASCESVNNTNGKSGTECACGTGYVGKISWDGPDPKGPCTAAECNFYGSNNVSGPNCGCADGFEGQRRWNNGSWTGNCRPAKCTVANAEGQGPRCQCKDGFQGSIAWRGPNATGSCEPASCASISDSNGTGTDCRCANGFTGNISWNGAAPSGNCTPAPCEIQNSNGQPGLSCKCDDGFDGEIKWEGDQAKGECRPASCTVPNSTHDPGWECKCAGGFKGDITWFGSDAKGHCEPAPCNVENSTQAPGLQCECLYKYEGGIKWDGPNPSGTCSPVACLGDGLNGVPGPECKCANGFAGEPMYTPPESQNLYWKPGFNGRTCVPAQCNISNSIGRGIACKCKDKFVGTISWQGAVAHGECTPALCNVTNSNKKPGPECDCLNGHSGHLYMGSGNKIEGRCSALPCKGRFSNQKSGPDCACADGYNGTVRKEMYDWDDNIWAYTESPHMLADPCLPAACDVDGSTGDPGLECHCRDGFRGEIIWEGPRAEGSCRPAPCSVVNSNRESGTDCRCLDGYDGSITWKGDVHVGTCTASPCRVLHSDFAAGPYCRCLMGFYGNITWNGNQCKGQCLPTPHCLENITHATSLVSDMHDSRGKRCGAGEQLVFHGYECKNSSISWTSAHSVEPGRCDWWWDDTACGHAPMNEFHLTVPLPLACSFEPAQPRCDSNIRYSITSTDQLHCPNSHGNETIVLNGTHFVEFQGQQCGYDLILWESVKVLNLPSCMASFPSTCGQKLPAVNLPTSCRHVAEPATFVASSEASPPLNFKFFDDGWYSVEGYHDDGATQWVTPWWSDGKHLQSSQFGYRLFEKLPQVPDGSGFIGRCDQCGKTFRLMAANSLPLWWSFKFQSQDAFTDTYNGCILDLFLDGTCYQVLLGSFLVMSNITESKCGIRRIHQGVTYSYYRYMYSKYGTQTYQSPDPCFPVAAHHQLEFEIVDLPLSSRRQPRAVSSSSMNGDCRTAVRYVVDAKKLQCDSHMKMAAPKMRLLSEMFAKMHSPKDIETEEPRFEEVDHGEESLLESV